MSGEPLWACRSFVWFARSSVSLLISDLPRPRAHALRSRKAASARRPGLG